MSKFPLWKYFIILCAVVAGFLYTLPNFYGEVPAVQISGSRSAVVVGADTIAQVNASLKADNIQSIGEVFDGKTLKFKFSTTDTQLKARDTIQQALGDNYIVALNLIPASPDWMSSINANPMFLGLDLRGGVHFLLEVDMDAAVKKTLDKYIGEVRRDLSNNQIRYGSVAVVDGSVLIQLRDEATADQVVTQLKKDLPKLQASLDGNNVKITVSADEIQLIKEAAVKQNILTLHNRVNELGVAEPIIQQQGPDRIVVELPGVQDTARAKDILGRTASLEVRMVDDDRNALNQALNGNVPFGEQLLDEVNADGSNTKILIKNDVELTGDNINDAQPGFDENGSPSVNIGLDSVGASIFKQVTTNNIGKRMAMVLVDHGKSQVVTAPVIRAAIGGGQVQISGAMSVQDANDVALLLRSGSLAAPMNIIEERTVGPSLGQENIDKGFHSVLWGFLAISIFMCVYYLAFGVVSVVSLGVNLLLLIALLSMLQATLTLPGIAAIALALGMAIDSNVLINERIREELRAGLKPHAAIEAGYGHAWATILDSNVTTLIAGLALLAFGSGPVKGFAVVHCLGILTSMFSAVLVSRGIAGFLYANRRIKKLYI
ncbi:MAG: protein translocase subunit SecD [Neisseriales bacterium]|nr:MAG: protein translocase subunit SecD [Neisseriales bacterium]HRG61930.1 protein translocase subunit SecD [Burkholderiales bacterium]